MAPKKKAVSEKVRFHSFTSDEVNYRTSSEEVIDDLLIHIPKALIPTIISQLADSLNYKDEYGLIRLYNGKMTTGEVKEFIKVKEAP